MRGVAVIPAFNEAATLPGVAARCAEYCAVIVVDDGSRDDTVGSVRGLPVTVLRNPVNQGKAASLGRGFRYALERGADFVVTLDADGQHPPEDIPRLLDCARRHPRQVVIGARIRERHRIPKLRRFAHCMANFWISWAAGHRIADTQSGFRVYPADLLRRIELPGETAKGFVFESEVLVDAARRGFGTVAVPIDAIYPPGARRSHYRGGRDTLHIVRMVAGHLLSRGMYPQGLYRSLRG